LICIKVRKFHSTILEGAMDYTPGNMTNEVLLWEKCHQGRGLNEMTLIFAQCKGVEEEGHFGEIKKDIGQES
jgi:hypothetical protein